MIKKTLFFSNPAYICYKDKQLVIDIRKDFPSDNEKPVDSKEDRYKLNKSIPIEDIGIVIIDHYGVVVSQYLLSALLENNVAVIICNQSHLPNGLFLNLDGNQVQSEKFKHQINTSIPLKKQLWQQTISAKIFNQTELLRRNGIPAENMLKWAKNVKSGDPDNLEARAANYYWKKLFPEELEFTRDRFGFPPNNLLNYGYAILRAITARSLVASGLLPTLGIHHHNKYNAFCLGDDIMEPYRPFVDSIVLDIVNSGEDYNELSTTLKKKMLEIATYDVFIKGERNPLMIGMQRTTSSLAKCFEKDNRKIYYPEFVPSMILRKKRKFY